MIFVLIALNSSGKILHESCPLVQNCQELDLEPTQDRHLKFLVNWQIGLLNERDEQGSIDGVYEYVESLVLPVDAR